MKLQDYKKKPVISGVEIISPILHKEDGGEFAEIGRIFQSTGIGIAPPVSLSIGKPSHIGDLQGKELQINYSLLHPGTIKAMHFHKNQTDIFFPLGKLIVNLVDLRGFEDFKKEEAKTLSEEYIESDYCLVSYMMKEKPPIMRVALDKQFLIVPPGVAHGIGNPYNEDRVLIYFVNQFFNPIDEFRIQWDLITKKEDWQIQIG